MAWKEPCDTFSLGKLGTFVVHPPIPQSRPAPVSTRTCWRMESPPSTNIASPLAPLCAALLGADLTCGNISLSFAVTLSQITIPASFSTCVSIDKAVRPRWSPLASVSGCTNGPKTVCSATELSPEKTSATGEVAVQLEANGRTVIDVRISSSSLIERPQPPPGCTVWPPDDFIRATSQTTNVGDPPMVKRIPTVPSCISSPIVASSTGAATAPSSVAARSSSVPPD